MDYQKLQLLIQLLHRNKNCKRTNDEACKCDNNKFIQTMSLYLYNFTRIYSVLFLNGITLVHSNLDIATELGTYGNGRISATVALPNG